MLIPFRERRRGASGSRELDGRTTWRPGIWTRDVSRAHVLARELRAGSVWVNTYRVLSAQTPFGGSGRSGHGRENGLEVLDEFTKRKTVWIELEPQARDPFVGNFNVPSQQR